MSDVSKKELQRLKQALDNYDYGIIASDYPVNGRYIADCLDALKAWEFLSAEQEKSVIKYILALIEAEPKIQPRHRKGDYYERHEDIKRW